MTRWRGCSTCSRSWGEHPRLRGRLALHGGTAINLFLLDVPRLSVDIDISYVGALGREEMLSERPVIEKSIVEVAKSQGYSVSGGKGGHAGRTFLLGYRSMDVDMLDDARSRKNGTECILCMECVRNCPKKAL